MPNYEQLAKELYKDASTDKLHKAISAGKQMDNSLKKEYGSEGSTDCHFRIDQYLKYFSYEAIKSKT